MSRRNEQITHRRKLGEIRNIMNSMKTLAIMETHKLERSITNQTIMINTIQNMAADFLHFNPQELPGVEPVLNTVVIIGSERGFCGDFNEQLVKRMDLLLTDVILADSTLIVVGSKLKPLLYDTTENSYFIKGANINEDIFNVVDELAKRLGAFKQPKSLFMLYHNNQHNELVLQKLLPPFMENHDGKVNYQNPPLLNLSAREFFLELTEHYLINALHQILTVSLMIENLQRIQHLENATHHLDDKTEELKRKINALRQEEIIEEIEVILLNAASN